MDIKKTVEIWKRNRESVYKWASEYARRTNTTVDGVMKGRLDHVIHDPSAIKVGVFHGFELSVIKMDDMRYRYTVLTPWLLYEGLGDTPSRDDGWAISEIGRIADLIQRDKMDVPEPTQPKATPKTRTSPKPKVSRRPRQKTTKLQADPQPKPKVSKSQANPQPEVEPKVAFHIPLYDERMANDRSKTIWKFDAKNETYVPMGVWLLGDERYVVNGEEFMHVSLLDRYVVAEKGHAPKEVVEATLRSLRCSS